MGRVENRRMDGWRKDMENEMWTTGFKYSWRKMEVTAQDTVGWSQVECGL